MTVIRKPEIIKKQYPRDNPLLYIAIANAYDKTGSKSKMTEYYERAMSIAPDNPEVLSAYGKSLSKYDKTDEAKIIYEKAIEANENNNPAENFTYFVSLGDNYYKTKDYKSALTEYQKAYGANPKDEYINIKLGNTYKGLNQLDEAINSYDEAIKTTPDNPDAYFNKGLCLAEQNKLDEAKQCFEKVIELKNDYAYAYYALGLAYDKENNLNFAVDNYEKFVLYSQDKNLKNTIQNKINNIKKKLPPQETANQ